MTSSVKILGNVKVTGPSKLIAANATPPSPNTQVTGATGNGTSVTLDFTTSSTTYNIGDTIYVSGMAPAGYNGIFVITGTTANSVTYACPETGAMTIAGTIQTLPAMTQIMTMTVDNSANPSDVTFISPSFLTGTFAVNWGDGTTSIIPNYQHVYAGPGPYTVTVSCSDTVQSIYVSSQTITTVNTWSSNCGVTQLTLSCPTLTGVPNSLPTGFRILDIASPVFNDSNVTSWNTGSMTRIGFADCTVFNQDISGWNTGAMTATTGMFKNCAAFNQPIGSWNVSNVQYFTEMFRGASAFNQSLNSWNTSSAIHMQLMFDGATAFNGNISSWNTGSVTTMYAMFKDATAFNGNITGWNTANVTDMNSMFMGASVFNQNIGGWTTTSLTNTRYMFTNAHVFNQNISSWNTANVTDMHGMFAGAWAFNQNISGWNTANVTDMGSMFMQAEAFNQNISGWNTANVTDMGQMFQAATVFDKDISGWTVTLIPTYPTSFATGSPIDATFNGTSWVAPKLPQSWSPFGH